MEACPSPAVYARHSGHWLKIESLFPFGISFFLHLLLLLLLLVRLLLLLFSLFPLQFFSFLSVCVGISATPWRPFFLSFPLITLCGFHHSNLVSLLIIHQSKQIEFDNWCIKFSYIWPEVTGWWDDIWMTRYTFIASELICFGFQFPFSLYFHESTPHKLIQ